MSSPPLASFPRRRAALVTAAVALLCATAVESAAAQGAREDKALRRPATASTVEDTRGGTCAFRICTPDKANDGRDDTRWGSAFADNHFWQVDLGAARLVDTVRADWQTAYPALYRVSTSLDGVNFALVREGSLPPNLGRNHVVVETTFAPRQARYIRLTGVRRATQWGFSLWTVNVFGPPDVPPPAPRPAPVPPAPAPAPAAPPAEPAAEPAASSGAPASGPVAPGANASAPLRPIAALTRVRLAGRVAGAKTSVRLLAIRAPRKATVQILCTGRGCPDAVPTRRGSGRIRELRRTLRAGAVLEVFITQPRTYGKYTRFRFRRSAPPRRVDRCVTQGTSTPIACPAGT